MSTDWDSLAQQAALLLSQYLQLRTVNPPGNERPAAEFLARLLAERGFEPLILEPTPGRALDRGPLRRRNPRWLRLGTRGH
jgi:acetylornithine deacetylase/succinyl-diaminopimelate desuccinylase-like protein